MSLSPQPDPIDRLRAAAASSDSPPMERISAMRRWAAVITSAFALGTGLVLAILPWTDSWSFNYLQDLNPSLEYLWHEPAFRGAVSGLGIANLMVSVQEGLRAFRRSST